MPPSYYVRYYKNDGSETTYKYTLRNGEPYFVDSVDNLGWSREGYNFVEWNTSADGTGTTYPVDYQVPYGTILNLYAIWEEIPSIDVEITYKGVTIATLSASGTLTLDTAGTYCEDDIVITYTKPS